MSHHPTAHHPPPAVHTTNTSSSHAPKAAAAAGHRVKTGGLNLPVTQAISLPASQKHETLIIPASSTASFGSYYTIDIREKGVLLHNLTLQFNYSAVSGTSLVGAFSPSWFHWTRIEIYQGGSVIDTLYNNSQFILQQMLEFDEDRLNLAAGSYANLAQRTLLSSQSTTNTFYCPLKTYFDQTKMALLTDSHAIQLRVYTSNLTDCFTVASGTLTTCAINSVNAICSVTRLDSVTVQQKVEAIKHSPHHYIMHDTRYGNFVIPSGNTTSTIVLASIVGNVSALMFTVRGATTGVNAWNYTQLQSFHLLDAASTSLVGGQPLPSFLCTNVLNAKWMKSSYYQENSWGLVDNKANVYLWSFSADPVSALEHGQALGSRAFKGNEQLVLNFVSALGSQVIVDVYALCENILEQGEFSIKKISM